MADAADIARIEDLVARGEYLLAYDAIDEVEPTDAPGKVVARLQYLRMLCLARSGATERAEAELAAVSDTTTETPPAVAEDIAALRGRLAKDRAFALSGDARQTAAAAAATHYLEVYERFGRPYACINAATLSLLAGDVATAESLARAAIPLAHEAPTDHALDPYWALVTEAEAALILGDVLLARRSLEVAGAFEPRDWSARASTTRQLSVLCDHLHLDAAELLLPIANPMVIHYTGHTAGSHGASGALSVEALEAARLSVADWFASRDIGFAYGSLASGSDIVVAEQVLRAGAELHVVLPIELNEFLDVSVRPAGGDWEARFERCLAAAASFTTTCDSAYLGHDELFLFGARVAMGQARIRASTLQSEVEQLAIWDGGDAGIAGTASDVTAWRSSGGRTHVVSVTRTLTTDGGVPGAPSSVQRPVRALLFGDIVGFGKLRDEDMVTYVETVLPRFAATLERYDDSITDRNTWGDAIFVSMASVTAAAECALALQRDLVGLDPFRMRMSVHVGPVLSLSDPVRRVQGTFGRELTRAARIEPRTPPGEVYTTAAFAALLALEPDCPVHPEYVGTMLTAKDFETIPMYVLKASPGSRSQP